MIEQLGGKQLVMNHMHHEDQLVRYNALLAVQKLMVHNWYETLIYLSFVSCRVDEMLFKTRADQSFQESSNLTNTV